MHPRRKLTPSPIARPTGAPRGLSPARTRAVLPTVAALLAMAAIGCERHDDIARDPIALGDTVHMPAEPVEIAKPALNVLEDPPPSPPPAPTVKAQPVHPKPAPSTPPAPGGLKAVHPIDPLST